MSLPIIIYKLKHINTTRVEKSLPGSWQYNSLCLEDHWELLPTRDGGKSPHEVVLGDQSFQSFGCPWPLRSEIVSSVEGVCYRTSYAFAVHQVHIFESAHNLMLNFESNFNLVGTPFLESKWCFFHPLQVLFGIKNVRNVSFRAAFKHNLHLLYNYSARIVLC